MKIFYKLLFFILTTLLMQSTIFAEDLFNYEGLFSEEYIKKESDDTLLFSNYQVKNGNGQNIQKLLSKLYTKTTFVWDQNNQQLLYKTANTQQPTIKKTLTHLDQPRQQIQLEAQIIEVAYTHFDEYQHFFSNVSDGLNINVDLKNKHVSLPSSFQGTLTRLIRSGKARVIAKPIISTLENKPALIKVGDKIPYVTNTYQLESRRTEINELDTGIEISVTPRVLNNESIEVDIFCRISSVKVWKRLDQGEYPLLSNREVKTHVQLKNNETLILAGLIDEQEKETKTKVPLLSKLPLLGKLLRSRKTEKTRSDIMFLITPKLK